MSLTAYKKLNLPLPAKMHEALFAESRETGVPATRLVRSVLEEWLKERRRAKVRRFAQAHAGTDLDIDPDLEAAATAELQRFYKDEDEAQAFTAGLAATAP